MPKDQQKSSKGNSPESNKPIDYEIIEIGQGNIWMKSWLNVTRFRNGDSILYCQDESSWDRACENEVPAYCSSPDGSVKYYNIACIKDKRGIAPESFKIPTTKEVEELLIKKHIYHPQSTIYQGFNDPFWKYLTEIRAKTQFQLFPSGARLSSSHFDDRKNNNAYFWTRTALTVDGIKGSFEYFIINMKDIYEGWSVSNSWQSWNQGFPVLCLKGNSHDSKGNIILEEKKSSASAKAD
jgi:uncharacterized protein (TIGR02145 family)